jgi:hypothetical protein
MQEDAAAASTTLKGNGSGRFDHVPVSFSRASIWVLQRIQ